MRIYQLLLCLLSFFTLTNCEVKDIQSNAQPVTHDDWDTLLKTHVNEAGLVDYKGIIADSVRFNRYLNTLRNHHPNKKNWTREEQLAYWINAYNAFTVKLIIDNYPTQSIKDIKAGIPFVNGVFDIAFIQIEGQEYSLNNIEHGIIRPKFNEPRIHLAVNCAARSCPKLANFAYRAEELGQQLEQITREFVNGNKNILTADEVQLSKILSWYWSDFKKQYDSRIEFLNRYSEGVQINADAKVGFLDYNWSLNEQRQVP